MMFPGKCYKGKYIVEPDVAGKRGIENRGLTTEVRKGNLRRRLKVK